MEKMVKIAVIFAALLAGIGVFYHYVIFLPGVERQKVERAENEKREKAMHAENEKRDKAKQEASRQLFYESCKASAAKNYSADWAAACEGVARARTSSLRNCYADQSITSNPYMGVNYCKSTFGEIDPSPNCSLPKARADSVNQAYQDEQQRCLAEARSGL